MLCGSTGLFSSAVQSRADDITDFLSSSVCPFAFKSIPVSSFWIILNF